MHVECVWSEMEISGINGRDSESWKGICDRSIYWQFWWQSDIFYSTSKIPNYYRLQGGVKNMCSIRRWCPKSKSTAKKWFKIIIFWAKSALRDQRSSSNDEKLKEVAEANYRTRYLNHVRYFRKKNSIYGDLVGFTEDNFKLII